MRMLELVVDVRNGFGGLVLSCGCSSYQRISVEVAVLDEHMMPAHMASISPVASLGLAWCLREGFSCSQLEMVPLMDAQQAAVGAGAATTSGAAAAKAATATATTSTDGSPANGAANGSKGAWCIALIHVCESSVRICHTNVLCIRIQDCLRKVMTLWRS